MTVACRYCGGTGTTIDANGSRTRCFACKGTGKLLTPDPVTDGKGVERAAQAMFDLEGVALSWSDLHPQFQRMFRERAQTVLDAAFVTKQSLQEGENA